jgi:glycosyltransferase involved in cell wall biosynthesis
MHILHICAYAWSIGGPPKVIFDHAGVALRQGHRVTILSPISPGETPYPVPDGATLVTVPRLEFVSRFFREAAPGLLSYLRRHIGQFDVVHCHGLWHFGVLAPFLLDRRVVKVVTIHGVLDSWVLRHNYWKKGLMSALFQKRHLRRADLIHVLSTDEADDLYRHLGPGTGQPNVIVIPNGIRPADFANLPPRGLFRAKLGLAPDQPMVLFMSRLNRKKGLELLLPAVEQLLATHPDVCLVLAGSDDGYEAETRAFVAERQLTRQIRLVGMLTGNDKRNALADADVFVLPSFSEGFSMAVLEAMAAGVPVLVSARVGFGPILTEKNAAYVADLTPDSIRQGLAQLIDNRAQRQQIQENARALVAERYDIDVVAGRLLAEYEKAIAGRRNAGRSVAQRP